VLTFQHLEVPEDAIKTLYTSMATFGKIAMKQTQYENYLAK